MLDKIKEIEACNYECEAGKLDLNVAWQELKEKAERYEKALEEINQIAIYYDEKGYALNPDKIRKIVVKALDY